MLAAADRVACGLEKLGIARGDRVGLFLPNVPHYLAAYFGALRLGAIVVNFSPLYTVDELSHQVVLSSLCWRSRGVVLFAMPASRLSRRRRPTPRLVF